MTGPGHKTAKTRRRLALQAMEQAALAPLRQAGHSCGDCANRTKVAAIGQTCDLDSDFHGYVRVQMGHLCSRWRQRVAETTASEIQTEHAP